MRASSPGPPGQANAAPWRRWLLPGIVVAFFVTLFALPRGSAPGPALSYTQFLADVSAGTVRAVTIGPAGQVTGSLTSGQPFTTAIPVALGGNGLAGNLAAHHVQVTATIAAMSSSPLSALIGLLPLLLIGGLLVFSFRDVRRQAGGMGGLNSLTKAKARVIDAERPTTRFTDVAGYTTVKTEITEVVDCLRDPGRYLASATALATQMVREFGLSEALGPVSYDGPPPGYAGLGAARAYSEHTQWLVDQEVSALLTKAESHALDLLTSHRDALTRLAATLLEQETVTGDRVRALARAASVAAADGRPASARPGLSGPADDRDGEQPSSTKQISS
jgi:ATP-dependent Zn protease